jgi:FkbM family methyltransferase
MSARRLLRKAAYHWHRLLARSERATRLYVGTVGAVVKHLPNRYVAGMTEWCVTAEGVPWKPLAFAPREVIVGAHTSIRLHPHLGEFDQAALFRKALDYERPVFAWLEANAAERYRAVIEIGANVGVYTVFLDALIKSSPGSRLRHVYAFEPSAQAYDRLLANLRANAAEHVTPFAVAIADATGLITFHEPEGHLTNGSFSREFAAQFSPSVRASTVMAVEASVLADILANQAPVLIKLDAEGAEPQILAALAPVLQRHAPDLLVEVLPGIDERLERLEALAPYTRLLLTPEGASAHRGLRADPSHRDWLLTRSP